MSDRDKHIIIAKNFILPKLEKKKRCLRQGNIGGKGQEKRACKKKPLQ